LGKRELSLFERYHQELIFWNKKMSLLSTKALDDIWAKHFLDSLAPIPFIANKGCHVLDIGAGAGFPGIPIKIAVPSLKVSLLEASRKKVSFLKHVIRTLALQEIHVIHRRLEKLLEEPPPVLFDTVISRATLKLPRFIQAGGTLVVKDGLLIAMKGPNIEEERLAAQLPLDQWGLAFLDCYDIHLPLTGIPRKIMVYQKVG
jgi:16S rRNA (guanine527-N7)-methyltransferase